MYPNFLAGDPLPGPRSSLEFWPQNSSHQDGTFVSIRRGPDAAPRSLLSVWRLPSTFTPASGSTDMVGLVPVDLRNGESRGVLNTVGFANVSSLGSIHKSTDDSLSFQTAGSN